ncbi:MAG: hypothetical protein ACI94D_002772, partial [Neolewinella sp.]
KKMSGLRQRRSHSENTRKVVYMKRKYMACLLKENSATCVGV